MARAATTILLITRTGLVRADLTRAPQPQLIDLWQQARPELPDLASLVEAALLLGPKPGKQVWVLCSDMWTQTLTLPGQHVANLPADETAAALNFEAEALSGHNAVDSVVAHVALAAQGGEQHFWIVQAHRADLAEIDDVVRRAGSRLAGFSHPGGLPRPLDLEAQPTEPWQRIELWPDAVLCIHGQSDGSTYHQVINSDPSLGRWKSMVTAWQSEQGIVKQSELLTAAGVDPPPETAGQRLFRMDNEAALGLWLVRWAEGVALQPERLPLLRPAPKPLSAGHRRGIAGVLALFAAAACAGHNMLVGEQIKTVTEKTRIARQPGVQLADVEKQLKQSETRKADILKQNEKLNRETKRLTIQRHRLAQLLAFLAQYKAEDLLIQRIDSDLGEPKVLGRCLQPEQADQFARLLAERMREFGWEVQPPRTKAEQTESRHVVWTFEIPFKPTMDDKALVPVQTGLRGRRP